MPNRQKKLFLQQLNKIQTWHKIIVIISTVYIPNQWIVLLTHSDWLLKLGIVFCYFKLTEVINKISGFFGWFSTVTEEEISNIYIAAVDTSNTKKTTLFSLVASEQCFYLKGLLFVSLKKSRNCGILEVVLCFA